MCLSRNVCGWRRHASPGCPAGAAIGTHMDCCGQFAPVSCAIGVSGCGCRRRFYGYRCRAGDLLGCVGHGLIGWSRGPLRSYCLRPCHYALEVYTPPMQRYFTSMNSSMPYFEPSLPMPDSFMPPNGATSVEIRPVLMPTMPYSSASDTRQTRLMSRL
jgi:hypothetical protein